MEDFYIGQIFEGMYPKEASDWCCYQTENTDKIITIIDIEPQNGIDRFQIVDITPTDEETKDEREKDFYKEFFNTSLGYVRRTVTMQDGTQKTFLTDLLPLITVGVPILTYDLPDFTKEITKEVLESLQHHVIVNEQFLKECQNQVIIDFYGFNPMN